MALFLNLPREIRDLIYDYILLSPKSSSRALVSFLPNHKLFMRGKQRSFVLLTNPIDVFLTFDPISQSNAIEPTKISLSIVRVSRQIYEEIHGRFWAENTLYFPASHFQSNFRWMGKPMLGVSPTLKAMGQTASRFITHIRLDMSAPTHVALAYHDLGRVLSTLASRARHGHFKYLELSWLDSRSFGCLVQGHVHSQSPFFRGYVELLQAMENGTDACKYERIIKLPPTKVLTSRGYEHEGVWEPYDTDEDKSEYMDAVAMDLHMAFGGKLFWGDELGWDSGVCKLSIMQRQNSSH